jgi:hypothetical protein
MDEHRTLTAFEADRIAFTGPPDEVAAEVRGALRADPGRIFLVLEDRSGRVVDIDLREPPKAEPRPRGRPRLGVAAREVTLLPRHWDWLAAQPGGASATLRRLVEDARRSQASDARAARDAAYRAMTVLAGDRVGYEEAVRALYAGDAARLSELVGVWPADVRDYVRKLAAAGA